MELEYCCSSWEVVLRKLWKKRRWVLPARDRGAPKRHPHPWVVGFLNGRDLQRKGIEVPGAPAVGSEVREGHPEMRDEDLPTGDSPIRFVVRLSSGVNKSAFVADLQP